MSGLFTHALVFLGSRHVFLGSRTVRYSYVSLSQMQQKFYLYFVCLSSFCFSVLDVFILFYYQ